MSEIIQEQIEWIKSGNIGCVFASALVKQRDKIGWNFIVNPDKLIIPKGCFIMSVIFPDSNITTVKDWALSNGFYIEDVNDMYEGLRIKIDSFVSWVQYFGNDSHVETRKSPYPMLSFTCKLPSYYYAKVGFTGILHLAHASVQFLGKKAADTLWNQSEVKTKKIIGHKLTIKEAAKTTYEK